MTDQDRFVPIKTLAEEMAEEANLDALDNLDGPTAPRPVTSVIQAPRGGIPITDEHRQSIHDDINRIERGSVRTAHDQHQEALGLNHVALSEAELAKEGARGLRKIDQAHKDQKTTPDGDRALDLSKVDLTKDEQAGMAYLAQAGAEMQAANQKAADEEGVPTIAKPLVAAAKGISAAAWNTAEVVGIRPITPVARDAAPSVGGATGAVIEGGAQFATDFIMAGKFLRASKLFQGVGAYGKAMIQGAAADALAFDPHQARISDIVEAHTSENTWLRNPLTEFLASDENDSDAMGRFKNAIEGFVVGAPLEAFTSVAVSLKRVAIARGKGGSEGARVFIEEADNLEKALPHTAPEATGAIPVFTDAKGATDANHLEDALNDYMKSAETEFVWNQQQIIGPHEMRAVLEAIGQKASDKVGLRTVQPLADLEAMADEIGTSSLDVTVAIGEMAKTGDQANAIIFAARKQQNAIANEIVKEGRRVASTGADKGRLNGLVQQLQNLQEALLPVRRSQGRGLRAWGRIADDSFSMQQIQAIIASGGNPAAIRKVVQSRSALSKGWNAYLSAWTNGLLSSPATHERNVLGNMVNMMLKPSMRLSGSVMTLDAPAARESLSHFMGLYKGFTDSWKLAATAFRANEGIITAHSKREFLGSGTSSKALGIEGATMLGRTVDALDAIVSFPGRLLTTADEFSTQINYRAARYAALVREAVDNKLTGVAATKYVESGLNASFDVLNHKGKAIQGAANNPEALDYALHASFQETPGAIGQGVLALAKSFPPIRLVIPFIKTLSNMTRQAAELTPAALLSGHWRDDIMAGGLRRKEAIAKLTLGTGGCFLVMSQVADGSITGSGPKDHSLKKQLMATGWKPFSIRIGNEYHSYLVAGSVGTMIAMVATLGERMGGYSEGNRASFAAHAAGAFADAMASQSFAQGFANAVEAMQSDDAMQHFLQAQAASHVPSIVNDFREGTDTTKRNPQTFSEAFMNRLPWMSDDVPAAYNTLGEKRLLPPGVGPEEIAPWMNAMTVHSFTERKGDIVLEEMERLQRAFDGVPRFLKLNDEVIDLSRLLNEKGQSANDRWNELLATHAVGGGRRSEGKTLRTALEQLITSDRYQALPDDVRPGLESERYVELRNTLAGYQRATEGILDQEFPKLRDAKNAAKAKAAEYRNKGPAGISAIPGLQQLLK